MKSWYHSSLTSISILLLPLTWIFHLIVMIRHFLYRIGVFKTTYFSVPVIVVGNIAVGGTGKTPLVIWLANFLKSKGLQPGIVSRGIGGKQHTLPYWVEKHSAPALVGDEALLLTRRTGCALVVCIDRVAAVKELLAKTNCNVVISDDGLQHYRLGRSVEIAVIDGQRGLGNQQLLPAGPLREPPQRLKQVNWIVRQGEALQDEFAMQLHGEYLSSLHFSSIQQPLKHWRGKTVHAVAGIGHPERFFSMLERIGLTVIRHRFPDHYLYRIKDFKFSDSLPIIMTEKDAVKCEEFADERFWYVPVDAIIDEALGEAILLKISG